MVNITLDLDGVLANLIKSTCNELNINYPKNTTLEYAWILEESKRLGFSMDMCEKIWQEQDFWANLELYPWSLELVDMVYKIDPNFLFVSKPVKSPFSYSGKAIWVQKHFPQFADRLILLNASKAVLANYPWDVLIDDCPQNLNEWRLAGGSVFEWKESTDGYDVSDKIKELKKFLFSKSILNIG